MSFKDRYLNKHILFEFSPGVIFFIANKGWGITVGIIAVIVATVVFVVLSLILDKRMPIFPWIGLVLILLLGGITLVTGDQGFIKIKPTIGKVLFAIILLSGSLLRPGLLARALHGQVYLSERGWTILTLRWAVIALVFAGANEFVWRNYDTDTWVAFASFIMPLSIVGYIAATRFTAIKYWNGPIQ